MGNIISKAEMRLPMFGRRNEEDASTKKNKRKNEGDDASTKKKQKQNEEDADTGAPGSLSAPAEANPGGSSSSPIETDNVASSSSSTGDCYEVFLSFRGLDTRKGFTDHLYHGLLDAGIDVFRDDDELPQGENIRPELLAAITNSKILIPILSVNYGTSSWCLDELVKIMDCKNNNGQIVLPIFYKVKPAEVGHQIGSFGDAFHKRESRLLERRFDPAILEKWKQALLEVSTLKGYEAEGYEADLVKSIVRKVLSELKKKFELDISENLVGIGCHVKEVMEFMDNKSHSTLFVGIHGMGGIGKTTLAKAIYNELANQFEHRSFIADIRESWKHNGAHYLQNQLIYDILNCKNVVHSENEGTKFISSKFKCKKVLVILDDVDDVIQVKRLAGNHDWFFSGSKIIITTRNEKILKEVGVHHVYDHKEMDNNQALILFSKHAFRRDSPPREFEDLTHEVVSMTGGLPLSLEVLGSSLCGEKLAFWRGTIDKLKKVPPKKVQEKLRISYELLDYEQKQIFLDIACFFIGTDRRIASYMWDACRFFPEEGIEVLRFMSLIKIGDDHELQMHDQLRDLGREIVREENRREPEKRSRLWDSEEVQNVLNLHKGTEKIEAINLTKKIEMIEYINLSKGSSIGNIYTDKQFKNLTSLRFLHMEEWAHLSGDFEDSIRELKWLRWKRCPVNFEVKNFRATELVALELPSGAINERWQGWSYFKMAEKLKFLNLSECYSLETADFLSAFKNLEVLILNYCGRLREINSSIGNMRDLIRLELRGCDNLTNLPAEIGNLKKLKQLLLGRQLGTYALGNARGISALPDSIVSLQNLEILDISGSDIAELPNDIGRLKKLKELRASECRKMEGEMPESIGSLENLEILDIFGSGITKLPDGIGRLRKLRVLTASLCPLKGKMPESICKLSSLQRFDVEGCKELQSLPDHLPSSLTNLAVTCQSRILPSLSRLTRLKELRVWHCKFLECVQELPSELLKNSDCSQLTDVEESESPQSLNTPFKLETLLVAYCESIEILDVSQFIHLRLLHIHCCENLREVRGLDRLKYLERLTIRFCNSRLNLPYLEVPKELDVEECKNLVKIQGLDRLVFLKELSIYNCASIKRLLLPKSRSLKILRAIRCMNLAEIHGLGRLEFLEELSISRCASIERLDLPKSGSLEQLNVSNCKKLVEIQGLDRVEFLKRLSISQCASIEKLHLPKSGSLKDLHVDHCEMLVEIQGLDGLEFLEVLGISGCASIERLNLPKSGSLKKLNVSNCKILVEIQGLNRVEFLKRLSISQCASIEKLHLPKSGRLKDLHVDHCEMLVEIQGLDGLEFLEVLGISGCASIERLDLPKSGSPKQLNVSNCKILVEIQGLDRVKFLEELSISQCASIESLPILCCFDNLRTLTIDCCDKLQDIQSPERFPSCESLWLRDCKSLAKLPNLSSFHNLKKLFLSNCHELQEIPGLEESISLKFIAISGCSSIEILPDLSSCTCLISLIVQNCEQLTELRGLEKLEHLKEFDISGCTSLKTIPELPGTQPYQNYENDPSKSFQEFDFWTDSDESRY